MVSDEIKEVIEKTVDETVLKLTVTNLLKDPVKSPFKKTEEILRNYPTFKQILDQPYTIKLCEKIEDALKDIEDDPYYEIIDLFYFQNQTRETIALELNTTVRTVGRNKARLVNILKLKLFSDDVIKELFLKPITIRDTLG